MFKTLPLLVLLVLVNCETPLNSDHNGKEDLICIMEDDTVGQCVPYNLCDSNKTFVDDDADVIYDTIPTELNRHMSDKNLCADGMVCCVPRGVQLPDNQSPSEQKPSNDTLDAMIRDIFGSPHRDVTEKPPVAKNRPSTPAPSINSENGEEESCTSKDGSVGKCVPYFFCDPNSNDIGVGGNSCLAFIEVCCLSRDVRRHGKVTEPPQVATLNDTILQSIFGSSRRKATGNTHGDSDKPSTSVPSINSKSNGEEESCTSKDGSVGKCVPYFFCDPNSNDIGVDGNSCSAYIEVCCLSRDVRRHEKVTEPPPVATLNDTILQSIFGSPHRKATGDTHGDSDKPSTSVPSINSKSNDEKVFCTMEDGTVGQCVKYFFCDENYTIVDDGTGVIYGNSSTSDTSEGGGMCSDHLDICCIPRDNLPHVMAIDPLSQPEIKGCGWRNPNGVDLKTTEETAETAKFGEFPWMVAVMESQEIEFDGPKRYIYVCGGSLIHPNVVLTLAHCVPDVGFLRIRAGEWDTQTTREAYPYQERDVASVELHKDFDKSNLYDAALLFLSDPVNLAPNVGVVCLPPPRASPYTGAQCFATGWGKDKYGIEGHYQNVLKKIELTVITRKTCQRDLRRTQLGRFFQLHSSFVCASGEKRQGTCLGDEGSPLSCPISFVEPRYMQSGIVAWGIGCGEYRIPGVYVDVSMVREWIDEKLILKGLDPRIADF